MSHPPAPSPVPTAPPRSLNGIELAALAALVFGLIVGAFWLTIQRMRAIDDTRGFLGQPQRERKVAELSGTGADGQPFRIAQLKGNVVLVTFGFTRCPDVCPDTLGKLAAVRRAVPAALQERVKAVFVSVDPRDDPSTLKGYLPFYDPSLLGLTGTPAQIAAGAKFFGAEYEVRPPKRDDEEYRVLHSDFVYAVDPEGRYALRFFHAHLNQPDAISRDLQRLLGDGK
ncbi:MAG: SCO family protein [Verrucomicrobia bacterium]|nr:SCO family protein [Verrucomicrobiota bacterium]